MSQQLRDPGRIPFIRFFAWAAAPLMRVADEHFDRAREPMIHRLPIDTRAFHRDHRTVLFDEPIGQGQERRRGGRKLTPFFADLPVSLYTAQTRRKRVLMDVDTTTDGMFRLHRCPLLRFGRPPTHRDRGAPATRMLFLRVIDDLDWWGCRKPDRPIE